MKKTLITITTLISIIAGTTTSHAYYKFGDNGYYKPSNPITCTYTFNGYTCS
jgi:hypothetical protein